MKIAIFTDAYPPQVNGVSTVVEAQTRAISSDSIIIFAPSFGLRRSTAQLGNITIERYPSVPWITDKQVDVPILLKSQVEEVLIKHGCELVHIHSPGVLGIVGLNLAKKLKLPTVATYHTLFTECVPYQPPFNYISHLLGEPKLGEIDNRQGLLRKLIWELSREIYNQCNVVIANSDTIKKLLVSNGHSSQIEVISNGVDTKIFKATNKLHNRFKILHVGRLSNEKNVGTIIRAFKIVHDKVPHARLEIVGGGPVERKLHSLASQLDLNGSIDFKGFIKHDQLPGFFQTAGLFATASIMETFGMVVLEALACGTPVVAVNSPGIKDLVTIESGILGTKVDDQDIAQNILQTFSWSDAKYNQMSRDCVQLASRHDITKVGHQLTKLYSNLISQNLPRSTFSTSKTI